MSDPYGPGPGWSYTPSGPFSQIAQAINQGVVPWITPMLNLMGHRERAARDNLITILNQPGLPAESKQKAIADYTAQTKDLPAWSKLSWPTVPQSVPSSQPNFMTGGAPVGGYNAAANPAFTSVPAPTTAPGVGPFASLGTTPQTPAPYVAPQMTQVPWIPRADPAPTPISSLPPATRGAIRAKLDPSLWSVVQDMKLGEAIQSFPMIRLALQAGGTAGTQGGTGGTAGQDATAG